MKHSKKIADSQADTGELNHAICRYVEEIESRVPADISAAEFADILRNRQKCSDILVSGVNGGSVPEALVAMANSTDDYYWQMMSMPVAVLTR